MNVLAVDLALTSGWALGHWETIERALYVPLPKQSKLTNGQQIEVHTHVIVDRVGVLEFPTVKGNLTTCKEAERLIGGYDLLVDLIDALKPGAIVFESAAKTSWLRQRQRTGGSMATIGAVRAVMLMAACNCGVTTIEECTPERWQQAILPGRSPRALIKSKSIEAALWRYGVATDNDNISDACHLLAYYLTLVNNGRKEI